MDTQPRPASVFLSYARRADRALADELCLALALLDVAVSRDVDDIRATERWQEKLDDMVRRSAAMLVLLSPEAIASTHCRHEWQLAHEEHKTFIVVRTALVADTNVPALFAAQQHIDHASAASFAALLRDIVDALRLDSEWVSEQNRLAALARDWAGQPARDQAWHTLNENQVEAARRWQAARRADGPPPTPQVLAFIAASEQEVGQRRRRRRTEQAGAALLAAAALGLAFWALSLRQETRALAEDKRVLTQEKRVLAEDKRLLQQQNQALDEQFRREAQARLVLEQERDAAKAAAAASPASRPALPVDPSPRTAPEALVAQFGGDDRRAASEQLVRTYQADPAQRRAIVDALVAALQAPSRASAYRINLYVLVTLARLPGWQAGDAQRARVQEAAGQFAGDEVYRAWAQRARLSAAPSL